MKFIVLLGLCTLLASCNDEELQEKMEELRRDNMRLSAEIERASIQTLLCQCNYEGESTLIEGIGTSKEKALRNAETACNNRWNRRSLKVSITDCR